MKMKLFAVTLVTALLGLTTSALAQTTTSARVVASCGGITYVAGSPQPLTMDTTGTLCTVSGGGGGGAVTIASGGVASGAYASGSIASGAFASGSIASGAIASGAIASGAVASGAIVDGAIVTDGTKADASYTTGSGSVVSILKGIYNGSACTGVINISQTTTTDVHTFTGVGHICSIVLISATAQSIGIDEGTGTTCESSGTALIGVSSTSGATATMAVAANGGFSSVAGVPWLTLQASADHLCVVQSASGNVSGTITYQDR